MTYFTLVLLVAAASPFVAAEDTPIALSLIQGHARKIVKASKRACSPSVAELSAADALNDFDSVDGGALSLIQGSQTMISAYGSCEAAQPRRARKVSKKSPVDPALFAAVADGVEDSYAALSLFQRAHGSRLKADECRGAASKSSVVSAADVIADEDGDNAAMVSLLQKEKGTIRTKKVVLEKDTPEK
eukprot:CAMPEP_0115134088 /NCGR_PEP_ID=MMETSP0227-20121206/54865_1 /TAXON_ID=89957 /ORGANISM="Polarella glacialis, Strain CCMP 1383" /LENGTH=187 /DNA_ID=CAMNT_0002540455 /DNA_START=53 /DNA_END=616 /DNA_ORIENTATION=-